ncbi:MAG: hypothetical protein Q7T97_12420 [Burkholderiaceae bacterium]|nr:hypothetical protein [Burkholderiaceae bacterium]
MRTIFLKPAKLLGALALLALAGCVSVPPERITTDRMDYGQVIAESWKRQTLLNVVRLHYADVPVFLDVGSIINSYSFAGKASAAATLPSQADPNVFNLGTERSWSNTPTVTYQPLLGDRFTKSLLQPVPPSSVFQLMQGGWSVDIVLRTVVSSINGLRNNSLGVGADPGFNELIETLSRIQQAGGLGIRVEPRQGGSAVVIVLRRGSTLPALIEDSRRVQQLLGLKGDISEFEIAYGLLPRSGSEVAMLSRSMLELLLELGFGIEVPEAHVKAGRVLPGRRQVDSKPYTPLTHIRSGAEAPADAYVAVPYRGRWYWIDDSDVASKSTFTFLLILFSLAETGQSAAAPVVTVPSR